MAKRKKNKLSETNELGARYSKNPTPETALELIKAFEGFLEKYVTLLSPRSSDGKSSLSNAFAITSDTKDFLRLFASKEDFKNSSRAYQLVAKRLPNMAVQSLLDIEDLRQSLTMIFLEKAQKFNPEIGGFTGYMKYHFKFAVKAWMFESHRDASKYQPKHSVEVDGMSHGSLYNRVTPLSNNSINNETAKKGTNDFINLPKNLSFKKKEDEDKGSEAIDFFGYDVEYEEDIIRVHNGHEVIDGTIIDKYIDLPRLTPSLISKPAYPFNKIWSKQERAIIVKVYVEDRSFSGAAEELGYSNATVVREMHDNAISKFREYSKGGLKP